MVGRLLERLAFNRFGGSENELRAANIIMEEIESLGGHCLLESFKIDACEIQKAVFKVTEPYELEIEVNAVGRSGSTPEGGIECGFIYGENCDEYDLRDAKGKIVLVNNTGYEAYNRLLKSGAAGFVVFSGQFNDLPEMSDIDMRILRPRIIENGRIPGVCMSCADAIRLVQSGAAKVKMEVLQQDRENTSHNVVSTIKGSLYPDEEIVITAHYDSVIYGKGAWDNSTGAVSAIVLYKYLMDNPPTRTVRFIWCGSEEQGVLGSKAYAAAHPDILERLRLCINYDMTGTTLGYNQTVLTGSPALCNFAKQTAKKMGYTCGWHEGIHSSDSVHFVLKGVPSIGIARSGQAKGHTRWDTLEPLSEKAIIKSIDFGKALLDEIMSAEIFPFEREMPKELAEKADGYINKGQPGIRIMIL